MTTPALDPICAPVLSATPAVAHGFFTRRGGASTGIYESLNTGRGSDDAPGAVAENLQRLCNHFGCETSALRSVRQIHSALCHQVGAHAPAERPEGDAMVTATPGVVVGVLTADCAPLLFADSQARVVAAAHSGWKGSVSGVIEATLEAMARLGATAQTTAVAIGPTISQKNYQVRQDFHDRVCAKDGRAAQFFSDDAAAGAYRCDLPGYIRMRLTEAGVGAVEDIGLCTYEDEARFFSYRRTTHRGEPDYGRMMAAIMLSSS